MMRAALTAGVLLLSACSIYDTSLLESAPADAAMPDACGAKCGGKCVDLSSNAKSCGECGHDCMGAGCTNGSCAPTVIAKGLLGPRGVVVAGSRVFVSNHGGIGLRGVDKADGANPIDVGGGTQVYPEGLAADATFLYWTNETNVKGGVLRVDLSNPSGTPFVVARDLPYPYSLALSNGQLFFSAYGDMNLSGNGCAATAYASSVLSCPIGGCDVMGCAVGGPQKLAQNQGIPRGVAVDNTNLYWVNFGAGTVAYCKLPSCTGGIKTLASMQDGPWGITSNGVNVVWTNYTGGQVMTCPVAGCDAMAGPTVIAQMQPHPVNVTLDGIFAYWTNQGTDVISTGAVMRCAVSGCMTPLALAQKQNGPWGITIDGPTVYWTNEGTAGQNSIDGELATTPK